MERSGSSMNQEDEQATLRAEYDFLGGIRGKHDEAYCQGTNLVLLEPDVAEVFKDSATVNSALRTLVNIARKHASIQTEG